MPVSTSKWKILAGIVAIIGVMALLAFNIPGVAAKVAMLPTFISTSYDATVTYIGTSLWPTITGQSTLGQCPINNTTVTPNGFFPTVIFGTPFPSVTRSPAPTQQTTPTITRTITLTPTYTGGTIYGWIAGNYNTGTVVASLSCWADGPDGAGQSSNFRSQDPIYPFNTLRCEGEYTASTTGNNAYVNWWVRIYQNQGLPFIPVYWTFDSVQYCPRLNSGTFHFSGVTTTKQQITLGLECGGNAGQSLSGHFTIFASRYADLATPSATPSPTQNTPTVAPTACATSAWPNGQPPAAWFSPPTYTYGECITVVPGFTIDLSGLNGLGGIPSSWTVGNYGFCPIWVGLNANAFGIDFSYVLSAFIFIAAAFGVANEFRS